MFRPVKTRKVYEEIVAQIKSLIENGVLKPGDKLLSERELSEQFSVSRASVREALSALEMMGTITIHPGEGSFVRHLPSADILNSMTSSLKMESIEILHLLEVRKVLEVETAAFAAMRATSQDIEELKRSLDNMREEVAAGGYAEDIDNQFHYILFKAAHNPVLLKVAETISHLLTSNYRSSRLALFSVPNMSKTFFVAHTEVFEAVAAKNSVLARERMREHIDMVQEAMRRYKFESEESLRAYPLEYTSRKYYGPPS